MNKKKKVLVALFAFLGIAVLGLAGAVYAKYIASFGATGSAQVAKWAFESDNEESELECSLTGTYKEGAIKTDTGKVYIAPGTAGTCVIELKNTSSEVSVDYTISADDVANWSAPQNLKLNSAAAASFADVTGTLAIGETKEVKINWEWPYYTNDPDDVEDTKDGKDLNAMSIKFLVKGVQTKPTN